MSTLPTMKPRLGSWVQQSYKVNKKVILRCESRAISYTASHTTPYCLANHLIKQFKKEINIKENVVTFPLIFNFKSI